MPAISKSSYIRGLKCPKSLWLHFNRPEVRDEITEARQKVFDTGHQVGMLAQKLFPGGVDASRGEPANYTENIAFTRALIDSGAPAIYEAAFGDGETLCYLDILARIGDQWHGFEVKSTTKLKEYHIHDAGFQYFVIKRSGIPLEEISIVHLNNQYIRRGEIEVSPLFTPVPITRAVRKRQKSISLKLKELQNMLAAETAPDTCMGGHCHNPYTCDFLGYCRQTDSCMQEPVATAPDPIPANRNQPALDEFLENLEYPLFFMDFETFMPAVPLFKENRPYQKIPFQFSLHKISAPGEKATHMEFLASPPNDPRPQFITSLIQYLNQNGTILVWNQAFEKTILREISRDFPEYDQAVALILPRITDLMIPFRKKQLYTPAMNGSFSLKAVVPAIVPELSYKNLRINDGGSANIAFEQLFHHTDPEIIAEIRKDLTEYCRLDTYSMVRILEKLSG